MMESEEAGLRLCGKNEIDTSGRSLGSSETVKLQSEMIEQSFRTLDLRVFLSLAEVKNASQNVSLIVGEHLEYCIVVLSSQPSRYFGAIVSDTSRFRAHIPFCNIERSLFRN